MKDEIKYFVCLGVAVGVAFCVFLWIKKDLKKKKEVILQKEVDHEIRILDWRNK